MALPRRIRGEAEALLPVNDSVLSGKAATPCLALHADCQPRFHTFALISYLPSLDTLFVQAPCHLFSSVSTHPHPCILFTPPPSNPRSPVACKDAAHARPIEPAAQSPLATRPAASSTLCLVPAGFQRGAQDLEAGEAVQGRRSAWPASSRRRKSVGWTAADLASPARGRVRSTTLYPTPNPQQTCLCLSYSDCKPIPRARVQRIGSNQSRASSSAQPSWRPPPLDLMSMVPREGLESAAHLGGAACRVLGAARRSATPRRWRAGRVNVW